MGDPPKILGVLAWEGAREGWAGSGVHTAFPSALVFSVGLMGMASRIDFSDKLSQAYERVIEDNVGSCPVLPLA